MMINSHPRIFVAIKYFVYLALAVNTGYFFLEDLAASSTVYDDGMKAGDLIVAFSASIDTAAWLVLLIILELETFVIPDEKLKGTLKWILGTIGLLCWLAIAYACYGYIATLAIPFGFTPASAGDACALVAQGDLSLVNTMDDYAALTTENCTSMGTNFLINNELSLVSTPENFNLLNRLAWIDIINSVTWLIVVLVLLIEITMRPKLDSHQHAFSLMQWVKYALYAVLITCAIVWGIWGNFWDIWDASLWLIAFFFIEMNIAAWKVEIEARSTGVSS